MKAAAAQLKLFFSGFGLPAYARDDVPDEVPLPYIAYDLVEPRWDQLGNMSCQVYYKKKSLEELLDKADEIVAEIGEGLEITLSSGYLMLYVGQPAQQKMSDEYTESIYISLLINGYHQPGV